ncbi:MAG: STAS domain-containing protein [Oscillochloridaceae bacterium umkhey_bin13]
MAFPFLPTGVRQWLATLPYSDPIQLRQAVLVQNLLLTVLALSTGGALIAVLAPIALRDALVVVAVIWLGIPITLLGLRLLHRGAFNAALLLACLGLILMLSFILVLTGVRDGGATIFGFAIPILLAGLLSSRRVATIIVALSGLGIAAAILLEQTGLPLVGIAAPRGANLIGIVGGFLVIASILAIFLLRLGQALRTALEEAQGRAEQLAKFQVQLEQQVSDRTADLLSALAEVETRAATQASLLAENAAQRSAIQRLGVPVLPVGAATLVVPLVGELDAQRLQDLQEHALQAVERRAARRLLLDVSAVPVVDIHVAQGLIMVVRQVYLLGAQAALVGITPEVAQALVALGLNLEEVRTYRDLEDALAQR